MYVEFPWPDKNLSPNARKHYMAIAKAKAQYRTVCYNLSLLRSKPFQGDVLLSITFHPPDRRKRDLDNMLASIKSGLDGLADAIKVNDHRFAILIRRGEPIKHGLVAIKVMQDELNGQTAARSETAEKEKNQKDAHQS